jgi:hypothetical protein
MAGVRAGLTTRASCLLAAGTTALLCGLLLGVIDLVRAGILALSIPLAAALVVYRSRVRISNRRSAEPSRGCAGDAVTIHLAVTNRSLMRTGALMLEDQLPAQLSGRARFVVAGLGGREVRTVSYRLPGLARGRYLAGPLRMSPGRSLRPHRSSSPQSSMPCPRSNHRAPTTSATTPAATRSGRTVRTTPRPASTASATTCARSIGAPPRAPVP